MQIMTAIRQFIQSRVDDGYYTPDTPKLFTKEWHPVFVYGTLRKGFCRHPFLEDAPFVGTGFTRSLNFRMWNLKARRNKGSNMPNYPVILPTIEASNEGHIYGEVYLVHPKTLRTLDYIESNGIQYRRIYRVINLNAAQDGKKVLTCWMYQGEPAAWKTLRENGGLQPMSRMQHPTEHFYYYVYKKQDQDECIAA